MLFMSLAHVVPNEMVFRMLVYASRRQSTDKDYNRDHEKIALSAYYLHELKNFIPIKYHVLLICITDLE